jgi:hypothetical protein
MNKTEKRKHERGQSKFGLTIGEVEYA